MCVCTREGVRSVHLYKACKCRVASAEWQVPWALRVRPEGVVVLIAKDEDHVKAREDSGLEVDLLGGVLISVVAAKGRVGRGEDGRARVEHGGDARLGDGDGLLLHGLVDGDAVLLAHLVELVDADDATVRKNHRTSL